MAASDAESMKIWVGRHVELELKYETSEVELLGLDVVADNAADFDHGLLGENTPLAKAIMGKQAGMTVPYRAGDIVELRILSVSEAQTAKPADLSERREEVTQKAIRQSDHTSLVIYASSMNSKWGQYDPGAIEDDKE
jgi:hypothetical protein